MLTSSPRCLKTISNTSSVILPPMAFTTSEMDSPKIYYNYKIKYNFYDIFLLILWPNRWNSEIESPEIYYYYYYYYYTIKYYKYIIITIIIIIQ